MKSGISAIFLITAFQLSFSLNTDSLKNELKLTNNGKFDLKSIVRNTKVGGLFYLPFIYHDFSKPAENTPFRKKGLTMGSGLVSPDFPIKNRPNIYLRFSTQISKSVRFEYRANLNTTFTGNTNDNHAIRQGALRLIAKHRFKGVNVNFMIGRSFTRLTQLSLGTPLANRIQARGFYPLFQPLPFELNYRDMFGRHNRYLYGKQSFLQDLTNGGLGVGFDGLTSSFDFTRIKTKLTFLYGTTHLNQLSYSLNNSYRPSYVLGGKVIKKIKNMSVGLVALSDVTYTSSNSINSPKRLNQIFSLPMSFKNKVISFSSEFAQSYLKTENENFGKGYAFISNLTFLSKKIFLPFDIIMSAHHIGANYYSRVGGVFHKNLNSNTNGFGRDDGGIVGYTGILSTNSKGINIALSNIFKNTISSRDKLKVDLAVEMRSELDRLSQGVTYLNRINGYDLNKFRYRVSGGFIPRFTTTLFDQTDVGTDGKPLSIKRFTIIEARTAYLGKLGPKHFFANYIFYLASAQKDWAFIPNNSQSTYLYATSNEFETALGITRRINLTNYFGYQKLVRGAKIANIDLNKDRSQNEYQIGLGTEFLLGTKIVLLLRKQWVWMKDKNNDNNSYSGSFVTFELKANF